MAVAKIVISLTLVFSLIAVALCEDGNGFDDDFFGSAEKEGQANQAEDSASTLVNSSSVHHDHAHHDHGSPSAAPWSVMQTTIDMNRAIAAQRNEEESPLAGPKSGGDGSGRISQAEPGLTMSQKTAAEEGSSSGADVASNQTWTTEITALALIVAMLAIGGGVAFYLDWLKRTRYSPIDAATATTPSSV